MILRIPEESLDLPRLASRGAVAEPSASALDGTRAGVPGTLRAERMFALRRVLCRDPLGRGRSESRRPAGSPSARSSWTAPRPASSTPSAGSGSSSSTRSRPSRRPQHLVLWSRLGAFDTAELDRLLWIERKLVEWNAFIWPIETLPLLQARMRRRRGDSAWERRHTTFLASHRGFRRYVLARARGARPAPLARARGPLGDAVARPPLVRQPARRRDAARAARPRRDRDRRPPRRAARCGISPSGGTPRPSAFPLREADRRLAELRFRARGVRLERDGWHAHPDAEDGPVPDRVTLLSPFDQLIADRDRAEALFGFRYRLEMYVPPRSASTATTCCRSSPETGSWGGSSRGSTAPPGRSRCSAHGETRRGSTRPLDRLADVARGPPRVTPSGYGARPDLGERRAAPIGCGRRARRR